MQKSLKDNAVGPTVFSSNPDPGTALMFRLSFPYPVFYYAYLRKKKRLPTDIELARTKSWGKTSNKTFR